MALKKRGSTITFIISGLSLIISLTFRSNITGFAVFDLNTISFPTYDFLVLFLFGSMFLGLLGMYRNTKEEIDTQRDIIRFELIEPNISINSLERYAIYCVEKKKKQEIVKENLMIKGWEEILVDEAFEKARKMS